MIIQSKLKLIDDNGRFIVCDYYNHEPSINLREFVFGGEPHRNLDGLYEILLLNKYTNSTTKLVFANKGIE